jgi:hypothetical protein
MVLLYLVRAIYWLAAALSTAAGLLVMASMLIAEHATQTEVIWGITMTVGILFVSMGVLSLGIAHYLLAIGRLVRTMQNEQAVAVWHNWSRLSIVMTIGGAMLDVFLFGAVYGILDRINQGFAVFG